jgi:hypothetical protein
MYKQQNPNAAISAANAPSINVRKGYLPGNNGDWCAAAPPSPYYTTPIPSPFTVTGNTSGTGSNTTRKTITNVSSVTNVVAGDKISDSAGFIPSNTTITNVGSAPCPCTITMSNSATGTQAGDTITVTTPTPLTSGLPLDTSWTGICSSGTCLQGNGQWDCQDYWTINHPGVAVPTIPNPTGLSYGGGTCGSAATTTASRYAVYRYEIAQLPSSSGNADEWSGNGLANAKGVGTSGNGESGNPYCAASQSVSGIDTTTGGLDRREFIVPIINCLAQNVSGTGQNATVPAAAFAKFFMTQPYEAPLSPGVTSSYIYGEMTGLVASGSNVTILNQVQLYR